MDIVIELIEERERRKRFFKNYLTYVREIKKIAEELFGDVEVYVFGSVISKDYHLILSDIDVAIVTKNKNKEKQLKLKVEVQRRFGDVFEVHVLNRKEWELYQKFIDRFVKV